MPSDIKKVATHLWRARYAKRLATPRATLAERLQQTLDRSRLGERLRVEHYRQSLGHRLRLIARERYRQAAGSLGDKSSHEPGWKHVGGANVFIGQSGTILAGCPGLKGEGLDEITDESDASRDEREQRQEVAQSHGIQGEEISADAAQSLHTKEKGNLPTESQPATIEVRGRSIEVHKDGDLWFWRAVGGPERMAASSELAAVIEQALGVDATSAPANPQQIATKAPPKPRARQRPSLSVAVAKAAGDWGLDPAHLRDAVEMVHEEKSKALRARELAKQQARKLTGLTAGDLARVENMGHDVASQLGGALGSKVGHFDEFAQEIAREYPELELGDPDDRGADLAGNLWDVLREGAQSVPPPYHPDIIGEAQELVYREQASGERSGTRGEEVVPFAREGSKEHYRKVYRQGQAELRRVVEVYRKGKENKNEQTGSGGRPPLSHV